MPHVVRTLIDLGRVRANAEAIRARSGVGLIAVVKADAYGHGAVAVAGALEDVADAWYVLHPIEASESRLFALTGKQTIAGAPLPNDDAGRLRDLGVRPACATPEQATRYAALDPVLSVDTGMGRFACPPERLDAMFAAHAFTEAMTHAADADDVRRLREGVAGRGAIRLHAAGTSLLDDAGCHLDAVRPGLALYRGAARVTAALVEARRSVGPVGYSGFESTLHHGVILVGYKHGLRPGPCSVNGRPQRIVEVGMQSAYVSLDPGDRAGDEVELLGPLVPARTVACAWGCGEH